VLSGLKIYISVIKEKKRKEWIKKHTSSSRPVVSRAPCCCYCYCSAIAVSDAAVVVVVAVVVAVIVVP
jgi:hypothetical protein